MPSKRPARHAPLLIHPGYHKTGTSWFQRQFFIPEFGFNQVLSHDEVFKTLVRPHGLTFDPRPAQELIAERRSSADSGMVDVISSEILSGTPFHGARESDAYAHRLKAVAPEARILLTIREQMRMLTAIYVQYMYRALTIKPRQFFADDPEVGYFAFEPEHLQYHRLVKLYQELYGPENVLVTTQEMLSKDGVGVLQRISSFAGVTAPWDVNAVSLEPESSNPHESFVPILRRINHFRSGPTSMGPLINLGPIGEFMYRAAAVAGRSQFVRNTFRNSKPVSREAMRRYKGFYVESNRELKAIAGADLDLTGYEM